VAVLSGARNDKNSYLAQQVYDRMKKLFPQLKASLQSAGLLLTNIYGSIGDFEKASNIRAELDQSSAKKKVGLTWIVTNGKIYVSS